MNKHTDLISRLQDEADLCRNDGATDIAALLDEAVAALRDRNHDTAVGEKWRTDSRLLPKRATAGVHGFMVIELLIVVAILGILAAVIVPAWNTRNGPTHTLETKDWQCLKEEERTYKYPVILGRVMVMQKGLRMECVEWRRVAG